MSDAATYCEVIEKPIETVAVPHYTDEEHGTWSLLLAKQAELAPGRASDEFREGLRRINFPTDRIPALRDISRTIERHTGWKLLRVDGLVHPRDFFNLLSRGIFPSTDFIRKRSELMYTPAPDMFHDLFGHTPLLTNPDFTQFFRTFGQAGVNATRKFPEDHPILTQVTRLYWFTVEFGLIQTPQGVRAYGSGSTSSPQELEFCVSDKCRKHRFDANTVAAREYDIWKLQEDVFVIDSFPKLDQEFRAWAQRNGIL